MWIRSIILLFMWLEYSTQAAVRPVGRIFQRGVTFPISSIPLHMHACTYARTHAHTHTHTHTHTLTHTHTYYTLIPYAKYPQNYPQSKRVTEYIQCLQPPGFIRVFPEMGLGKRITDTDWIFTELISTLMGKKMATSKSETTSNSVDLSQFEDEIGINSVFEPV